MRAAIAAPAAALLLALAPGAAAAQDLNEAACRDMMRVAGAVLGLSAEGGDVAATPDGWCEARPAYLSDLDRFAPRPTDHVADLARWRGEGPDGRPLGPATGFGALELEVESFRTLPNTGDEMLDYLLAAQREREGMDLRVAAGWDPATGALRVSGLSVEWPGRGTLSLAAVLRDVDLATPETARASLGTLGVTTFSGRITTTGLFEDLLLVPLGTLALAEVPPDLPIPAAAEFLRERLVAGARDLPLATFPGGTPEALAALAAALPHPEGTLSVDLAAPGGIDAAALARVGGAPSPAKAWAALEGATLTASWTPLPPGE